MLAVEHSVISLRQKYSSSTNEDIRGTAKQGCLHRMVHDQKKRAESTYLGPSSRPITFISFAVLFLRRWFLFLELALLAMAWPGRRESACAAGTATGGCEKKKSSECPFARVDFSVRRLVENLVQSIYHLIVPEKIWSYCVWMTRMKPICNTGTASGQGYLLRQERFNNALSGHA